MACHSNARRRLVSVRGKRTPISGCRLDIEISLCYHDPVFSSRTAALRLGIILYILNTLWTGVGGVDGAWGKCGARATRAWA